MYYSVNILDFVLRILLFLESGEKLQYGDLENYFKFCKINSMKKEKWNSI